MSPETATDPRIRPAIMAPAEPRAAAAKPAPTPAQTEAPFAARAGAGGNRVNDYGPGADHPTVAGDFGFADLLDVINPLQHLPVVSSLYRRITGDEIGAPARVMGAALYGGPLGLVVGAANALVAEISGEDPGEQVLTALLGPSGSEPPAVALAENQPRGEHHPPVAQGPVAQGPVAQGSAPEPATGQAALDALYRDLRAMPDASSPEASSPKTSSNDQALFTERMMTGLDKYQALSQARGNPSQTNSGNLDLSL